MKGVCIIPPRNSDSPQTFYKYFRPDSAITLRTTEDGISSSTGGCSVVVYIPLLPTNLFILAMFAQVLLDKYRALSCKHFCSSQHTYSWHLSICRIRPLIYNECQATFRVFQLNVSRRPYPWRGILEIILQLVFQAHHVPMLERVQNKMGGKNSCLQHKNILKASLNLVLFQSYQELCLGPDLI